MRVCFFRRKFYPADFVRFFRNIIVKKRSPRRSNCTTIHRRSRWSERVRRPVEKLSQTKRILARRLHYNRVKTFGMMKSNLKIRLDSRVLSRGISKNEKCHYNNGNFKLYRSAPSLCATQTACCTVSILIYTYTYILKGFQLNLLIFFSPFFLYTNQRVRLQQSCPKKGINND